jgi:transglutaminase-like putative cysteine protease
VGVPRPDRADPAGPRIRQLIAAVAQRDGIGADAAQPVGSDPRAGRYETGTPTSTPRRGGRARRLGVCQDHAQIFIAAARALEIPARYVSGYLMMDDRIEQEATHAWAEAWVQGLGWVGFDVSNGISPDPRYVRVATGPRLSRRGALPGSASAVSRDTSS